MKRLTLSIALCLTLWPALSRADSSFTGVFAGNYSTVNWDDPKNWSAGVPGVLDFGDALIQNGGTAVLDGDTVPVIRGNLVVGSPTQSGALIGSGSLFIGGDLRVGGLGNTFVSLNDRGWVLSVNGSVQVGMQAGMDGKITQGGEAYYGGNLIVGGGGNGTYQMNGGSSLSGAKIVIGGASGGGGGNGTFIGGGSATDVEVGYAGKTSGKGYLEIVQGGAMALSNSFKVMDHGEVRLDLSSSIVAQSPGIAMSLDGANTTLSIVLGTRFSSAAFIDLDDHGGCLYLSGDNILTIEAGSGMKSGTYTLISYSSIVGPDADHMFDHVNFVGFDAPPQLSYQDHALVITVPEPGTVLLLVAGLPVLFLIWRRKAGFLSDARQRSTRGHIAR